MTTRASPPDDPSDGPSKDPVLEKRERIRRLANTGQRVGYLLYGIALLVFFAGLAVELTPTMASVSVGALVVGSLVLAPSILLGYAVKAAEREEQEERGEG